MVSIKMAEEIDIAIGFSDGLTSETVIHTWEEEDSDKAFALVSDEVERITRQAEETFKNKGRRWDTYFYKVHMVFIHFPVGHYCM